MARRRNGCCFPSRSTSRRPSSMRSTRIASCWHASVTRSSRSPAAASSCTRRQIRIPVSKRRAACRSWSPISPAAGLAAGRIVWSGLPRRTPAEPRSRRARHSTPTRCASSSSGCFRPHSPRPTCMAGPRWSSCQRKSWNGVLAAPDTRHLTPVIVGPTGVGKTAVAVAIGALVPITVISADARQIYRGLDIGTAKPDRATRARVPHRGLDLIDAGERYSAGRFARDAAGWIAEAVPNGRRPIVAGGTGLYIRALAEGLFREPPFDADRREQLRTWSEALEGGELARWAGRLDPRFPGGGRQRAARAVEVALLTGRALSWWQQVARESGALRPWYIHLTLPREALHRRLAARVDSMLAAGLVEEVRGVLAAGVRPDAAGLDGVGYREVVSMLQGRLPEIALRDAILVSTRRYAKRQETWFRNQLKPGNEKRETGKVWMLDATDTPEALAQRIFERWRTFPVSRVPFPES